jgi:hypothetical protein
MVRWAVSVALGNLKARDYLDDLVIDMIFRNGV